MEVWSLGAKLLGAQQCGKNVSETPGNAVDTNDICHPQKRKLFPIYIYIDIDSHFLGNQLFHNKEPFWLSFTLPETHIFAPENG